MAPTFTLFLLLRQLIMLLVLLPVQQNSLTLAAGGSWNLLVRNAGISAMHMQLLRNDRVVIIDRTTFGPSNITLPNRQCVQNDCTAHSVEYDVASNSIRPLTVLSNTWCSSGAVTADGTLIHTGGFNDGGRNVRTFRLCNDNSCDWQETRNGLSQARWYATDHILPDGRQIVVGGRRQFNYEFYPKTSASDTTYALPFLSQTNDRGAENNLYPFVFLNVDGNLFIFANNRAILFDYRRRIVVRTYPTVPGGDPRNYPSTGSAVLLPLTGLQGRAIAAEVLVCGGAPKGAFTSNSVSSIRALNTCARIQITDTNPQWIMETMPQPRVMGDMLLLPNGNVLIINGASLGTAGWEIARGPVLAPAIYRPDNRVGSRFEVQTAGTRPRMYHSTACLLRDGRVLVGGSNPHAVDTFTGVLFPTDLTLEAYSPYYLEARFARIRPRILAPASQSRIRYGQQLTIQFRAQGSITNSRIRVTMLAPPFNTHSFSMNQRLLVLGGQSVTGIGRLNYQVQVVAPPSTVLAPAGYYMLFVVNGDIPSEGIWVQIG